MTHDPMCDGSGRAQRSLDVLALCARGGWTGAVKGRLRDPDAVRYE